MPKKKPRFVISDQEIADMIHDFTGGDNKIEASFRTLFTLKNV
jgi:hypothetical protein